MFVKPNAKYEVIIGNEFKDKFLFGSYANTMSIVILENATPIKINQVAPPLKLIVFTKYSHHSLQKDVSLLHCFLLIVSNSGLFWLFPNPSFKRDA